MAQMGLLQIREIAPRINGPRGADRGLDIGRSGSGKSVLAREILKSYGPNAPKAWKGNVIIIDPNDTFPWKDAKTVRSPDKVIPNIKVPYLRYVPPVDRNEAEDWNLVFSNLFNSKLPLITYVDELYALEQLFGVRRLPGGNYLTAYLTRGRAKHKAFLASVQSPTSFPLSALRQAEFFYVFDLPLKDDRIRVGGVIGEEAADGRRIVERNSLGRHEFYFKGPDNDKPLRSIVRL